jgi:nitrogen PTS system EIIA component
VAVPHAVIEGARPSAVLATLARPLRSETPDDAPLRLVVVLVGNERGRRYLERLAQVARLATDDVVERLCAARDPAESLSRLAQIEAVCC